MARISRSALSNDTLCFPFSFFPVLSAVLYRSVHACILLYYLRAIVGHAVEPPVGDVFV